MQLLANGKQQFLNQNGAPLAGGFVYHYAPGTNTPVDTYKDQAGTAKNTNPIGLDSRGQAVIWGTGTFRQVVTDAAGAVIWDQVVNAPDASAAANSLAAQLLDKFGAALVGFIQSGAGAVKRTVLAKLLDLPVSISDFGVLGAGNDRAILQAAVNYCKNEKVLDLGSYTLDLGNVSPGNPAVTIDSPVNMKIIGNGALIKCVATLDRCVAIAVKNPINFVSEGIQFTNPGFDISSTVSGVNRIGVYGYYVYATAPYTAASPCGPVSISGAAHDCIGFVVVDSTTQLGVSGAVPFAVKNVKVTGHCERVYYGMSSVYGATDIETNLICQDVRRGFISYGQQRAKIDLSLQCSAGFLGSNAFVELACEGSALGDVSDIDIRVRVSGVEAHDNIVNFYHQQSGTTGSIGNVKARVTCDNLTAVGKASGLNAFFPFCFLHEDPATSNPIASTTRATQNIDIDCDILGTITGSTVRLSSIPQTLYPITLGRGVTSGLTDFGMWIGFKVLRGARTGSFTPQIFGRTTAGAATYSLQKGELSIVDGVASYAISLTWSGHTGTGNAYVGPFPVNAGNSNSIGYPAVALIESGFGAANSLPGALITDQGQYMTIYQIDITSRALSIPAVPAAGTLYLSGTFPLYP